MQWSSDRIITLEQALNDVRQRVSTRRYQHIAGVVETTAKLSEAYHLDLGNMQLSAALHDVAKEMPRPILEKKVKELVAGDAALLKMPALWHAPVGADIAEREYGLAKRYSSPIRWHTTGRAGMSLQETVLYVADQIEPSREFSSPELIALACEDLYEVARRVVRMKMEYTLQKFRALHPQSVECWNWLLEKR